MECRTNQCASRWLRSWQSYESYVARPLGISHATTKTISDIHIHICAIREPCCICASKFIKPRQTYYLTFLNLGYDISNATRCHLRAPHPYLSVKVRTINLGWQLKCTFPRNLSANAKHLQSLLVSPNRNKHF